MKAHSYILTIKEIFLRPEIEHRTRVLAEDHCPGKALQSSIAIQQIHKAFHLSRKTPLTNRITQWARLPI